jgi:outer membrane protein assembly factor BamA
MPTFAELEAAGARIGEIRVLPGNIFDLNDPRENNFFFRLANAIHIQTRPQVIRQALLFESGQPVSVQKIEETERLLRGYDFLYDVDIRPVAVHDGVVDVEVRTRDTWSLDVSASASREGGANKGRISVAEENLLGTGISIGVGYTSDVDRNSTTFNIADSNVFGTRTAASYAYSMSEDGHGQSASLPGSAPRRALARTRCTTPATASPSTGIATRSWKHSAAGQLDWSTDGPGGIRSDSRTRTTYTPSSRARRRPNACLPI